jgi:hypothetical protein
MRECVHRSGLDGDWMGFSPVQPNTELAAARGDGADGANSQVLLIFGDTASAAQRYSPNFSAETLSVGQLVTRQYGEK